MFFLAKQKNRLFFGDALLLKSIYFLPNFLVETAGSIINLHVNMQIKFASGKCIHVNYNMSLAKLKFLISERVINSQLMNYIINIYSHKSQVESEQLKLLLQVHVHNVHV
jgi:hypothetical protein